MVRTGLIIVIDPGHGGNSSKTDLGARSHDKGMEKTVNLTTSNAKRFFRIPPEDEKLQ
jgi:N-acetylmuramoyl-L-alanine amidase